MPTLPAELLPLIVELAPLFSKPVWERAITLLIGAIQLIARWAPDRHLVVGDSSFTVMNLLCLVGSTPRVDLITRLRLDAQLYDPTPKRIAGQVGSPRVKGAPPFSTTGTRQSQNEMGEDRGRSLVRRAKARNRSLHRHGDLVLLPKHRGPDSPGIDPRPVGGV
jgi:hypothetical protein